MKTSLIALFASLGLLIVASMPAAADPPTQWTVFDYNASGHQLAPRNSPNSMPATQSGDTWSFAFKPGVYTALFTTTDANLTGDLTGRTLTDMISLGGDATTFQTQFGGGDCVNNVPAAVRFFFTAPAASGSSVGTPPAGFYTQFWWSDAMHMDMTSGNDSMTLTESMLPADWSDWNGQPAATQADAFSQAVAHVQSIGLSFGGDCFFETGVAPLGTFNTETFSSTFSES
jgi:hypothetical protein